MKAQPLLPKRFSAWLKTRGWSLHPHQKTMLEVGARGASCLLIAPTGGGKTLAGFLPSLVELDRTPQEGLHTLYISPLKALTTDIHRNLTAPIEEMGLSVTVDTRTGDTSSSARARQKKRPPNLFLTTPESLALMLSYAEARQIFGSLKTIVIDEVHALEPTKRGLHTALLLSRLAAIAPEARRVGLSATVADPERIMNWLGRPGETVELVQASTLVKPQVSILSAEGRMPIAGHFPKYAIPRIYEAIKEARASIIFVNTRATAEMIFQSLWEANVDGLSIALHHGSLDRVQRQKVEAAMASGKVRAVVATASLDLGIDWGDVDLVIQIGAPKGISRLLQRIGRSNHRYEEPSRALLVPGNCFEAIECLAAKEAVDEGDLDAPDRFPPTLDILAQHILNCACAEPIIPGLLYEEIIAAQPYRNLTRARFERTLQYVIDGGYVLQRYDQHHRLVPGSDGSTLEPASPPVVQRHRMNIGTIVESTKLKVVRISKREGGKRSRGGGLTLGEVEESLVLGMEQGDVFMFAGQMLKYEQLREMNLECTPASADKPTVPTYAGNRFPLSTHLAERVRAMLQRDELSTLFDARVGNWLDAQDKVSRRPGGGRLLCETFKRDNVHFFVTYPFEGRPTHQSFGFLFTRRMEHLGLKPLGFTISDYGLALWGLKPVEEHHLDALFSPTLLVEELEEWLAASPMLKRYFRNTAVVAGLIEQRSFGKKKTGKQVTFSSDLIYDVLRRYEPGHVLLESNRMDAERELIGIDRLENFLHRYREKIELRALPHLSPFSIPIICEIGSESVYGSATEEMLRSLNLENRSELMFEESQQ